MAVMFNNTPQQPALQQRNQQKGTGFTNLSKIIGANQQNKLGQTVGSGVGQQIGQAKEATTAASQQFQTEADKNRLDSEQNKNKVASVIQDPTKATDQDVSQFQTFRSGRYGGPTEIKNEQQLQGQAQSAQSLGNLGQSAGGRQALLQRFVGGEGYTQGKQKLDNLLLGQSGGNQLRQASRDASGLVQDVNKAAESANQTAKLYQNKAQQFGQDVNNQLDTAKTGINNQVNTSLQQNAQNEKQRQDAFNALSDQFSKGTVSSDQALSTLAGSNLLNDDQKKNLLSVYSSALNNGITPDVALKNAMNYAGAQNLNFKGVASDQQLNSINALDRLKGGSNEYDLNNPTGKFQAGTLAFDQNTANQNIQNNALNLQNILSKSFSSPTSLYDNQALFSQAKNAGLSDDYIKSLAGESAYNAQMSGGGGAAKALQGALQSASGSGSMYNPAEYQNRSIQDILNQEYNKNISSPYTDPNAGKGVGDVKVDPNQYSAQAQAQINAIKAQAEAERNQYSQTQTANQGKLSKLAEMLGVKDYAPDNGSPGALQQNQDLKLALLRNQAANAYTGIQGDANQKQNLLDMIKSITGGK